MAIICKDIIKLMEKMAPPALAEDWDNVGLIVGKEDRPIEKILIALDATNAVIEEAIDLGVQMIITHHPMPFRGMKKITTKSLEGQKIIKLIENGINLYAAHTNLDIASGGTNDVLAQKLGLVQLEVLDYTTDNEGLGKMGYLSEPMMLKDFASLVKKNLGLQGLRLTTLNEEQLVSKVAICTGAGEKYLREAMKKSADVYVTGDMTYHYASDAMYDGMSIIDAGHYGTEVIVVAAIKNYLEQGLSGQGNEVSLIESRINGNPFKII